jgi:hypothetical protein
MDAGPLRADDGLRSSDRPSRERFTMAICEDAPCCGCCGPAVWAADALSAEESAFDDDYFYGGDFDDPDEWDDDDDPRDGNEDAAMESALWGEC